MPKIRKIKQWNNKLRKQSLLHYLAMAMQEHPEITSGSISHKTDVIGIACQYGGAYNIRREDFDELKDLTIGELINEFDKDFKTTKKFI